MTALEALFRSFRTGENGVGQRNKQPNAYGLQRRKKSAEEVGREELRKWLSNGLGGINEFFPDYEAYWPFGGGGY